MAFSEYSFTILECHKNIMDFFCCRNNTICINSKHFMCTVKSFMKSILLSQSQKPNIPYRMCIKEAMLKPMFCPESIFSSEGREIFTNITQCRDIIALTKHSSTPSTVRCRDNRRELDIRIFLKCFEQIGNTRSSSDKYDFHDVDIVEKNGIFQLLILQNKKESIISP